VLLQILQKTVKRFARCRHCRPIKGTSLTRVIGLNDSPDEISIFHTPFSEFKINFDCEQRNRWDVTSCYEICAPMQNVSCGEPRPQSPHFDRESKLITRACDWSGQRNGGSRKSCEQERSREKVKYADQISESKINPLEVKIDWTLKQG